jgi:hypothetical protein
LEYVSDSFAALRPGRLIPPHSTALFRLIRVLVVGLWRCREDRFPESSTCDMSERFPFHQPTSQKVAEDDRGLLEALRILGLVIGD